MTTLKRSTLLRDLGGIKGIKQLPPAARFYAAAGVARQLGNERLAEKYERKAESMSKRLPQAEQPRG